MSLCSSQFDSCLCAIVLVLYGYTVFVVILPNTYFVPITMPSKLTRKQIAEGLDQQPIDILLLGQRSSSLTSKQKAFAKEVALGATGADAYRKAYNSKGKPKSVGNNASKLKAHDGIALEIKAIQEAIEFNKSHSSAQLRALVVSQLTKEALNEDNPPASRLTALKALGTVAGVDAFIERKEIKTIRDSDTARADLMAQLKQAISENMRTVNEDTDDADELMREISGGNITSDDQPNEILDSGTPPSPDPQDLSIDRAHYMHSIPHNLSPKVSDHTHPPHDFRNEEGEGVQNSESGNITGTTETPPSTVWIEKG